MTAANHHIPGAGDPRPGAPPRSRSHAVPLLQLFALTVMVIPSDTVIQAIGAGGYPAALVGMFAFAAFLAATLLGLHNPLRHRHPVRSVLCLLWLAALASYVLMDRRRLTVTEAGERGPSVDAARGDHGDRAGRRGVSYLAVRRAPSLEGADCWGGAFCGVVAALQFWVSLDIAPYLRELPGILAQLRQPGIIDRAALNRVAGTAIHPIELGVVAGMLLPLAIYLAIYDTDRSARSRWAPVALIGARDPDLGVPIGDPVGRAGARRTRGADAGAAAARSRCAPCRSRWSAVFMSAPGLIGTLDNLLRGRHERSVGGDSRERLSAGRAARAGSAVVWPRRRDVHRRQRLRHSRQPVPEDRDRARPGRGRRAGRLFPGAGRSPPSSRGAQPRSTSSGCSAPRWPAPGWPRAVCSLTFDSLSFPDVLQRSRAGDRPDRSRLATREPAAEAPPAPARASAGAVRRPPEPPGAGG